MQRMTASLVILFAVPLLRAEAAETVYPGKAWQRAAPAEMGMDAEKLQKARDYALTGGGSGFITRHGRLVLSWGDADRRYGLKSTTKSIGVTALGLAIKDGKLELGDKAVERHRSFGTPPESNAKTGWLPEITLLHLATQTAGFAKPGGYEKLLFEPGTKWSYSDGGPNWLAECVTLAYGRDLNELMFERVFAPLGIERNDLRWRNNAYRPREIEGVARREFGSGISANVDAMARIGYLYLREGKWKGRQIIPAEFVKQARTTVKQVVGLPEQDPERHGNASDHYGLLWWNNADGTIEDLPRDAYWSWGLYDSLIVVIPSLDVVVSRAGRSWERNWSGHYDVLKPFLQPIARSVRDDRERERTRDGETERTRDGETRQSRLFLPSSLPPPVSPSLYLSLSPSLLLGRVDDGRSDPPYPASRVIRELRWAPAETIIRKARGCDNWPLTWADDGLLYAAYGDGRGFAPKVEKKLSLGLARVLGSPRKSPRAAPRKSPRAVPRGIHGENIRSPTAEQIGDGARGKKASGMLMVEGVLSMWVRNADNSQLASSDDHGKTWTWADWRFRESFGAPTFLNFGRNYAGARDGYVYVYSHDSDSAYQPADRMVLARVPKDRIMDRDAYEFFVRRDDEGRPVWSGDIAERGAVFEHAGRCYRSGISYNAPLKRYLWCQTIPGGDTRFEGGFGIYDAAEPWGPWTTVYYTEKWDVGPGETQSIPTKWIGSEGASLHMVFSGDDAFSVRRATLRVDR